jgi:type III secretion protein U
VSERTEAPTPRRRREARRRGDVPRSLLLGGAGAGLGGALAAAATWSPASRVLAAWAARTFAVGDTEREPVFALASAAGLVAWVSAPVLAGALASALLASVAVGGLHLDLALLRPRMERIAPLRQLGRRLRPVALLAAARPLLLLGVLGLVGWAELRSATPAVLVALGGREGFAVMALRLGRLVLLFALVTAALGVADAMLARFRHRLRLRMTRQELIEEQRQTEGDPRLRARRRALHRSLLLAGRARGVRSATVLVVNPTHLAVGLRYASSEAEAPYLVGKGRGGRALALRREAERWRIPVVEDVPLARSLVVYDVGEEIPEELYQAAAEILRIAASIGEAADAEDTR